MTSRAEEQIRADIVEAGRRLYARAYVASNDGNISARLDAHRLITTPKSVSKGFMTPDMMVIVDYEGRKLAGERDPSTELPMHLEIYRNRPEINAVVHDCVAEYHGSISAEHGIGRIRRDELPRYKSAVELALMRKIKAAIDPLAIMNPGKVI